MVDTSKFHINPIKSTPTYGKFELSPLIGGFVVGGAISQTVLIRAVGPTLQLFGVSSPLTTPKLDIYGQNGAHIASSSDGINTTNVNSAASLVGAFPLPGNAGDAAMVITLGPGAYTGVITSSNGSSGNAMLEVYELP